jgi:hypothetical protein
MSLWEGYRRVGSREEQRHQVMFSSRQTVSQEKRRNLGCLVRTGVGARLETFRAAECSARTGRQSRIAPRNLPSDHRRSLDVSHRRFLLRTNGDDPSYQDAAVRNWHPRNALERSSLGSIPQPGGSTSPWDRRWCGPGRCGWTGAVGVGRTSGRRWYGRGASGLHDLRGPVGRVKHPRARRPYLTISSALTTSRSLSGSASSLDSSRILFPLLRLSGGYAL